MRIAGAARGVGTVALALADVGGNELLLPGREFRCRARLIEVHGAAQSWLPGPRRRIWPVKMTGQRLDRDHALAPVQFAFTCDTAIDRGAQHIGVRVVDADALGALAAPGLRLLRVEAGELAQQLELAAVGANLHD